MDVNKVRDQLEIDEGKRLVVYTDTRGYPTAGIGHKLTAQDLLSYPIGSTITEEQCQEWFTGDLQTAIQGCIVTPDIPYENQPDAVQDSLVNLAFNMGVKELSLFYTFLSLLKERNYTAAADHLLTLPYAKDVPERAERIAAAIKSANNLVDIGAV